MNRSLLTAAARLALRRIRPNEPPDPDAPRADRDDRPAGPKDRLIRAAGRLWALAHPTNASGNNMSQR